MSLPWLHRLITQQRITLDPGLAAELDQIQAQVAELFQIPAILYITPELFPSNL